MSESIKNSSETLIEMFDRGQLQDNAIFPYVVLYKKLKAEISLFNEYKEYIKQIEKMKI